MDKRLEKALQEELKLKEQMKILQDRLSDVADKREIYEKETLYKTFKDTTISLEEYQMIIKNAVNDYMGLNDALGGKENE